MTSLSAVVFTTNQLRQHRPDKQRGEHYGQNRAAQRCAKRVRRKPGTEHQAERLEYPAKRRGRHTIAPITPAQHNGRCNHGAKP